MRLKWSNDLPRSGLSLLGRPNAKGCAASVADHTVVALQNRFAIIRHTIWAKEVFWLSRVANIFKTIHDVTRWGFPKFISCKIGLLCLCRFQLGLERSQLLYQLRIRHLRVRYLQHQVTHGEFDLRVSTCLRRAEKSFECFKGSSDLLCRAAGVSSERYRVLDGLKIDVHGRLQIDSSGKLTRYQGFET